MGTEIIQFTESADEELALLKSELRLSQMSEAVSTQSNIPEALRKDVLQALVLLQDLFGTRVPTIDEDPMETLRLASRDIHLGKLLRERGVFRLYRLLNEKTRSDDGIETPLFMTQADPDSGELFKRREDFIMWFCREAKVARATVFQRIATIDKLQGLGLSLEEAYKIVISKPYAIQESLNMVANWEKGGVLVDVKPQALDKLAERVPEKAEEIRKLQETIKDPNLDLDTVEEAREKLSETMKPVLADLMREVAAHPSVHDAMDYVRHDVAGDPEIKYRWDYERDEMVVDLVRKKLSPEGDEYISEVVTMRLIPDPVLPPEIRQDLIVRLPVRNREIIDG